MKFLKQLKRAWDKVFEEAARQSCYQVNAFPWAALIGAAGNIIGGIGKSATEKKRPEREEAARYKYDTKAAEDRIKRAEAAGLKPTTPRHEYWSGLSQIAPFMQNAIMGSFADIFGQDTLSKWGSSYDPTGAGGNVPMPPPGLGNIPIAPPGGGGGMPPEPGDRRRPMPPWMGDGGRRERF